MILTIGLLDFGACACAVGSSVADGAVGETGGLGAGAAGRAGAAGAGGALLAAPHDVQNCIPCPRGAPQLVQNSAIALSSSSESNALLTANVPSEIKPDHVSEIWLQCRAEHNTFRIPSRDGDEAAIIESVRAILEISEGNRASLGSHRPSQREFSL